MTVIKDRGKTIFVCQGCGQESLKWLGRCPQCGQWNSFVERRVSPGVAPGEGAAPQELSGVSLGQRPRLSLPSSEFNRVLGGGLVPGSLVLIGGDPGIGKSTLLLQMAAAFAGEGGRVLYVSGEESVSQIKLRAERLGLGGEGLFLLPETDIEVILERLEEVSPGLAIIDSIQSVYLRELGSTAGSVGQVRECTMRLMHRAKAANIPLFLVGHVTKDGTIAGPHVLEHIVDVVLYLEGEPYSAYRVLRGVKNRFGSTNEVGVFEMRDRGIFEVTNPSQAFLSQRPQGAIGSAIIPTLEGTRPLLVEVQALTTPTFLGTPRRTANGIDFNRLLLIVAVLTKRVGLRLGGQDVMVNVVGGLQVKEPAADLGIALAIASSLRNLPVSPELVALGEVGLSGELRAVTQMERRLAEVAKLGFSSCLLPRGVSVEAPSGIKLLAAGSLREALRVALV